MDDNRVSKKRVNKPNRRTYAAQYNLSVLAGLQRELEIHPEKDITSLLSTSYSARLEGLKDRAESIKATAKARRKTVPKCDVRSRLCDEDEATILLGPSPELEKLLLRSDEDREVATDSDEDGIVEDGSDEANDGQTHKSEDDDEETDHDSACSPLAGIIMDILDDSDILYRGVWAASRMVFRVSDTLVAKFAEEESAVDEYHALEFLRDRLPTFPAPRAHGVVVFGCYGVLFSDFIAGCDLSQQWPQMSPGQKQHVSSQLDTLFTQLRALPRPPNTLFGALQGAGRCRDGRRALRSSTEPISTVQEFEDWVFSGSSFAQPVYIKFLRDLLPRPDPTGVFTHGDLRLENMIVKRCEGREGRDDEWEIGAVIDWEMSGFYPEYWESIKVTNCMISVEKCDWYNYLPMCFSPRRYTAHWAVDRVWDFSM